MVESARPGGFNHRTKRECSPDPERVAALRCCEPFGIGAGANAILSGDVVRYGGLNPRLMAATPIGVSLTGSFVGCAGSTCIILSMGNRD